MTKAVLRLSTLCTLALAAGCGDKDDGDGGDDTGSTTTDDSGTGGTNSDAPFFAAGTYNGDQFQVECYFDDSDPEWTASLQCQDDIQFFITCRADPEDGTIGGLKPDNFQVWLYLHTAYSKPGVYEVEKGQTSVCVGNNGGAPLCTNWGGVFEEATIEVDEISLWTSAKGSFSASWSDEGKDWATINGSFDFTCD